MKAVDLVGQRFGRLVVLERAGSKDGHSYWRCRCDCGTVKEFYQNSLASGKTQSCGCYSKEQKAQKGTRPFNDLKGRRFGRLLVLERDLEAERQSKVRGALWQCQCDCGNIKRVRGSFLVQGAVASCGCYARDSASLRLSLRALPPGEAAFNELWARYLRQAEQRGLSFNLNQEEFRGLVCQPCYYCGTPPDNFVPDRYGRNGSLRYSGVDRKDSSRGYEPDNCVPCCFPCNKAKGTRTTDEFLSWVGRVADHQRGCSVGAVKA